MEKEEIMQELLDRYQQKKFVSEDCAYIVLMARIRKLEKQLIVLLERGDEE